MTDPQNGIRQLWCAVLMLTVQDALQGVALIDAGGTGKTARVNRAGFIRHARRYLTTPSKDLAIVCAGAGLDMEAFIDRMVRLIAEAPPAEELAEGRARRRATCGSAGALPQESTRAAGADRR